MGRDSKPPLSIKDLAPLRWRLLTFEIILAVALTSLALIALAVTLVTR